ncbi:hypothetical protein ACFSHR_13115 [Azotobacter chroococcum]
MSGSPRIIRDLGQLIEQLDIRRAQVLVEAIIVEMGKIGPRKWASSGCSRIATAADGHWPEPTSPISAMASTGYWTPPPMASSRWQAH